MFWPIRIGSIVLALLACFALDAGARQFLGSYEQRLIVLAGLYVTLAVSLNLINGITGQFSIGHAAFYQVGATLTGYMSITLYKAAPIQGIPWLIAMVVMGAVFAAIAGLIVGLPSLRLRGDYLAIVTLGFGEIIRIVVQNTDKLGGSYGLNIQPKFPNTIWLVWLLAILCIATCRNLLKTAHGLPFLAVREDEVASSAMGVNVTGVKVSAFILGSAFAGAAGALLGHYEGFITPQTFRMDVSFIILTMVVLGGTGSITGSVVSAIFLSYLPEWLRGLKNSTGGPLTVSFGAILAALIATAVAVTVIKSIMSRGSGTSSQRGLIYLGVIVGSVVLAFLLGIPLGAVPALSVSNIEAGQLRMVIFAVTLIVIMLLRPQGIFAHHEFSWSWLRHPFRKPKPAVSA